MFKKMNLNPNISKMFSKTYIKVLFFLIDNPASKLYEREIAANLGISIGAVNQALRIFTEERILNRERKGKLYLYTVNMWNPLTRQFKITLNVMKLFDFVMETSVHAQKIVLFGSSSEGTNTKQSDIDLFVMTKNRDKVISSVRRLEAELGTKIDTVIVEPDRIADFKKENKELYEQINCGIKLWDENELRV